MIDSKILTSQAKEEPYENIEDELEKIIIQDIKAQIKHEAMMKAVQLARSLKPSLRFSVPDKLTGKIEPIASTT